MQTTQNSVQPSATVDHLAERATRKAEQTIADTQQVANEALVSLKDSVSQVQELTRRGIDKAMGLGADMRERALKASDRTASYVQDEPLKAVLLAAAAGAAVALLVRALSSRKQD